MTSWLHDQRFAAVQQVLAARGCRSVLDLGCGSGDFLLRLVAGSGSIRIVGVEPDPAPLAILRADLARLSPGIQRRVRLVQASVLEPQHWRQAADAAVMVEVFEHLDPAHLSRLETALFGEPGAPLAILTTPNADFNPLLGVPPDRFRHPGHRFEWGRARFRTWAESVAVRWGWAVTVSDIAGNHPTLGGASQMAVFVRQGYPTATPVPHSRPSR